MDTDTVHFSLHVLHCETCGVMHVVPRVLFDRAVATQGTLYCLVGHAQQFGVEPKHEAHIRHLEFSLADQGVRLRDAHLEIARLKESLIAEVTRSTTAGESHGHN